MPPILLQGTNGEGSGWGPRWHLIECQVAEPLNCIAVHSCRSVACQRAPPSPHLVASGDR